MWGCFPESHKIYNNGSKMGMYKYIRNVWKKPSTTMPEFMRARLVKWRREPATLRIDRPTRLDRARSLGYRAKQGIIVVRQRVMRGGHRKPFARGARRSKKYTTRLALMQSYQTIAEQRAARKYLNCEVLNSYQLAQDGKNAWFEVILIDRDHPAIKKDKSLSWITKSRGRVFRGKTSSARKSRGLRHKGKGVEKLRPSRFSDRKRRKE